MTTPFLLTESYETPSGDDAQESHARIEWVDIHGDGTETTRTGSVWALAPPLGGQGAVWVLPDHPDDSEPSTALLVRLTSKRHRAGRIVGVRWFAKQGRWIDVGEAVREDHPASPYRREEARQVRPTAHARFAVAPNDVEMAAYVRTVARLSAS